MSCVHRLLSDIDVLSHHSSVSSALQLKLLQDDQWHADLQVKDPFAVYKLKELFVLLLTLDPVSEIKRDWITRALARVASLADLDINAVYLDVFHTLLKQLRHNQAPFVEDHPGRLLLQAMNAHPQLDDWIHRSLQTQNTLYIIPFLVCMIDVVKTLDSLSGQSVCCDAVISSLTSHYGQIGKYWQASHITAVRKSMELSKRLLQACPTPIMVSELVTMLHTYINSVRQHLTESTMELFRESDRTEFFYQDLNVNIVVDRECLKSVLQMVIASCQTIVMRYDDNPKLWQEFHHILQNAQDVNDPMVLLEWIFDLCGNNDDDAVDLQMQILAIYERFTAHDEPRFMQQMLQQLEITPHTLFIYFLYRTGTDHEILVDFLISNETEFLAFLIAYLRYVDHHLPEFMESCEMLGDDGVDLIYHVFERLLHVLEAGGFPYNPAALARRITHLLDRISHTL
ncbi:uncharacterized protein BYT42DRAFT_612603 [Radiomyces spectabilis]|uniref:uncharacterized protein n=1 Tax=Radiomyces spectabilis TaxID=64574 RepID=UPI00221E9CE9|nr:uncharacterized protein BYT42DRAFT_612603 [Radiomyces spectabilis]KAI8384939.1 hypothetical protein BYT42DRAFT_612603 [Radiomyces spectabilis]